MLLLYFCEFAMFSGYFEAYTIYNIQAHTRKAWDMLVKSISDHGSWQRSSKGNIRKFPPFWDFITGPIAYDEVNLKTPISVYVQTKP
jgi:hypothetical protein